ncbi:hypothetical protein ACFX13_020366 [Malus domestica]
MAECIYDLDGPEDLPESPELVEFLRVEPDKPPQKYKTPWRPLIWELRRIRDLYISVCWKSRIGFNLSRTHDAY